MIYKPVSIFDIVKIQEEVLKSLLLQFPDLYNMTTGFSAVDTEQLKKYCTTLKDYLESKDLFSRWADTGLSFLKDTPLSIHTDSHIKDRTYALNIPILNCDNSFTIWYTPKENVKPKVDYYRSGKGVVVSFHYKDSDVDELCRLESNSPAIVNIKTPHRGISFNGNPRYLLSLRFRPELTEEEISQL